MYNFEIQYQSNLGYGTLYLIPKGESWEKLIKIQDATIYEICQTYY